MTANKKISDLVGLGCIHVISGDGKGKTTSSLGLALRAAGHGFKTIMIQFMKKGWDYGELNAVELLPNIQIIQSVRNDNKYQQTFKLSRNTMRDPILRTINYIIGSNTSN